MSKQGVGVAQLPHQDHSECMESCHIRVFSAFSRGSQFMPFYVRKWIAVSALAAFSPGFECAKLFNPIP
jgi:hypothetical protein